MAQWTIIETLITLIPFVTVVGGGIWWLSSTLTRFEDVLNKNTESLKLSKEIVDKLSMHLSEDSDRITALEYRVKAIERELQDIKEEMNATD